MSHLRAAWRVWRLLAHVASGALQILVDFPHRNQAYRDRRVQVWAARALIFLGVQLRVVGTPPAGGPLLLVVNHSSWLDIVVRHAARHCRFVSKDDVRRWPLIGLLATGAGTLYVKRASSRDAMRVVHHMTEALRDGDVLAVFPEGTTSDGRSVLPFHANLLQAAIAAPSPVLPVALSYADAGAQGPSRAVTYIDDESLVGSIWRTLGARDMTATVVFGSAQNADGRDRRAWAQSLREAVLALRSAS